MELFPMALLLCSGFSNYSVVLKHIGMYSNILIPSHKSGNRFPGVLTHHPALSCLSQDDPQLIEFIRYSGRTCDREQCHHIV
jgi:hypothetical protein